MTANAPLSEAHLNTIAKLPFSNFALQAYLDPRKRDDPKVQRQVAAQDMQTTWNGGATSPKPAQPVTPGAGEALALSVLRSAKDTFGSGMDLTRLAQPSKDEDAAEARRLGYLLGLALLPMSDGSVVIFDGIEGNFTAWSSWQEGHEWVIAAREENERAEEPKRPAFCLAEAFRLELQQQHLDPDHFYGVWLSEESRADIGRSLDVNPRMMPAFLQVEIYPMTDESILILDPDARGWRSARDGDDCNMMLSLKYAPHSIDKWWRNNLQY